MSGKGKPPCVTSDCHLGSQEIQKLLGVKIIWREKQAAAQRRRCQVHSVTQCALAIAATNIDDSLQYEHLNWTDSDSVFSKFFSLLIREMEIGKLHSGQTKRKVCA